MAIEQVKAFYQRLAADEAFRTQIKEVKSKEECSQIVKTAGYEFTQQEFEDYTEQILEADPSESKLKDLSEKELEAVLGGQQFFLPPDVWVRPMYGLAISPWTPPDKWLRPMYGAPKPQIDE